MKRCKPITRARAQAAAKRLGMPTTGPRFEAFFKGAKIEREHRDVVGCSVLKAGAIARAHLRERKDYYDLLERYVEPPKRGRGAGAGVLLLAALVALPFLPP